jgi:hypothetical protein
MLPQSILALSAFVAGTYATASANCNAWHSNSIGNVYAIYASNVADGSIGSICGSFDTELRKAVKNDGSQVRYKNNFCHTYNDQHVMQSVVELDKQSPSHQANLVRAALVSAFGSAGVSFSGCDVSGLPV